jgi:mannose-6-phosphate isomerase-like protein (cupin superfamily)
MKIRLVLFFISCGFQVYAQHFKPKNLPKELQENAVEKISEDSLHSTFLITIPEKVPLHFHKHHTENIVVLGGKALMKLGSDTLIISKGDQLTIPKGTPHEVIKVRSRKPLRVYSIQSPLFDGSDRYFVKP